MSGMNEPNTDLLEKMLQYAGRRESVDTQRMDRVEQQLWNQWRQLIQKRRVATRRRQAKAVSFGVALAASLVIAVIYLPRAVAPSRVVALVANVVGSVENGARGQPMTSLTAGSEIFDGSVLETDNGAGMALNLTSGHSLRIAASSRLRIEADTIILDRGKIYLDSGPDGSTQPITVHTTLATVSELGTQYQVQLTADGLELSVREGRVKLLRAMDTTMARSGEALRLGRDGSLNREAIQGFGAHWIWAARLGPAIDINGHTLAEFLDWLARENGWRISYASATLHHEARITEISGSIENLSAREALDLVMSTGPWTYSIANGVVMIAAGDGDFKL